jgi:GxxExxY protein
MIYEKDLSDKVIGLAIKVHKTLGHGFLEKVYENALCIELLDNKISFEQQKEINVYYNNQIVGQYFTDIIVEDKIILELKAVKGLDDSHYSQLHNYLNATNYHLGYLINFGSYPKLEFKRIVK